LGGLQEQLVISFSVENPQLGQNQVSRQLKSNQSAEISPYGVRQIWLREQMNTVALRFTKSPYGMTNKEDVA